MSSKLTDTDPMPFGKKHKGVEMANVPDSYLKWMWEEYRTAYFKRETYGALQQVMFYIADYGPENLK